ncbi:MAG: DUF4340 domain-containing protein [Planctomycetota bacterium]|nr:DUF4340 domain-containing protein [Planctomycetota bacterium]
MHGRTILVLVVVVGLLFAAQRWASDHAEEELQGVRDQVAQRDLLFGVTKQDFARLAKVRIDNLERTVQVTMERDSSGAWFLTDPIAWPAEVGTLNLLFETLEADRGLVSEGARRKDVGLDPPRAICELEFLPAQGAAEGQADGVVGRFRLEIGAVDLDPSRLFVAVTDPDGQERILRANRSLESIFQRFVPDYRSRAILRVDPSQVVEVRRSGPATLAAPDDPLAALGALGPSGARIPNPLLPPEPFRDLEFRFASGDKGWEASTPYRGAVDPQAAAMLIVSLASLDAEGFHAEQAADLALYGFDEPELEVELVTADREVTRIAFARSLIERREALATGKPPEGSEWLCMVAGLEQVFEVDPRVVMLSSGPPDAFSDARIVRGSTAAARSLTYAAGGREVVLRRAGTRWLVSGLTADGGRLDDLPATEERVEEFLQSLRAVELQELRPGASLAPTFVAEHVRLDVAGELRGGRFAPIVDEAAPGKPTLGFQRIGEELVAEVGSEVLELLRTPPENFLERQLFEIDEVRMAAVELTYQGASQRYVRDPKNGRWSLVGATEEARAFANLVDRLRSQRALSFAFTPEGQAPAPLVDPVEVRIEVPAERGPRGASGFVSSFELSSDPEGFDLLQGEGPRARIYPGLWSAVVALFGA